MILIADVVNCRSDFAMQRNSIRKSRESQAPFLSQDSGSKMIAQQQ